MFRFQLVVCAVSPAAGRHRGQRGQVSVFVVLALGIFLLAAMGFAVDVAGLWFHRQAAQTAADAACTAGAMDMLVDRAGGAVNQGGFTLGSAFDCAGSAGAVTPCAYAALNGYNGAGLQPGQASNDVAVSFPASLNGIPLPPPNLAGNSPYIRVDVADRVRVFFMALLTAARTQDVHAQSVCGLVLAKAPVPILVLHPYNPHSLYIYGTPIIRLVGGPNTSIQVNSSDPNAVDIQGSAIINLMRGGPLFNGSSLGVFGGPALPPAGFLTQNSGSWDSPQSPLTDPFATLAAPDPPLAIGGLRPNYGCTNAAGCLVNYKQDGCPDPSGCTEYSPGYYPTGIQVKNSTGIFDPGLYYLAGGLSLDANSMVRPSGLAGDGSGGATFYFSGVSSVSVAANSGSRIIDPYPTAGATYIYTDPSGNVFTSTVPGVTCPGGLPPDAALSLPSTLSGSVLMGPCSGAYGTFTVDSAGATYPAHGMLFFQDRSAAAANGNWGGGGQMLLMGDMYFHQCASATAGSGEGCATAPTAFNDTFTLSGNSGSGTYILGDIVTDTLLMNGTPTINMQLNDAFTSYVLKASLLQ